MRLGFCFFFFFFFFNDTATTEIYTLSLHDALPISGLVWLGGDIGAGAAIGTAALMRSEEHTSELQSHDNLVCRLLLEKKSKSEEHTSELQPHDNLGCRLLLGKKQARDRPAVTPPAAPRPRGLGGRRGRPGQDATHECARFFFNDRAHPELYPLPLHGAFPN